MSSFGNSTFGGGGSGGPITASQITDSSASGRQVLTGDPGQGRSALGLGTAATRDATDFATAAQGAKADSALQPGTLPAGTTIPLAQVTGAGAAAALNVGTAAGTVMSGDDTRLTQNAGSLPVVSFTGSPTAAQWAAMAGKCVQFEQSSGSVTLDLSAVPNSSRIELHFPNAAAGQITVYGSFCGLSDPQVQPGGFFSLYKNASGVIVPWRAPFVFPLYGTAGTWKVSYTTMWKMATCKNPDGTVTDLVFGAEGGGTLWLQSSGWPRYKATLTAPAPVNATFATKTPLFSLEATGYSSEWWVRHDVKLAHRHTTAAALPAGVPSTLAGTDGVIEVLAGDRSRLWKARVQLPGSGAGYAGMLELEDTLGRKTRYCASADVGYVVQSSAGPVSVADNIGHVILNITGSPAVDVTVPQAPTDGQLLTISCAQAAVVTISAGAAGKTIITDTLPAAAGSSVTLKYVATINAWLKF